MTHENSNFGNFEDERRKFGDPVARNRWFIFILAFVKKHFTEHILCSFSIYIMELCFAGKSWYIGCKNSKEIFCRTV